MLLEEHPLLELLPLPPPPVTSLRMLVSCLPAGVVLPTAPRNRSTKLLNFRYNVRITSGVRRAQAGRGNAHKILRFGLLPSIVLSMLGVLDRGGVRNIHVQIKSSESVRFSPGA